MNAILLTLAVLGCAQDQLNPRQFRIDVLVCKGDPLGSIAEGTIRNLAQPSISCFNGHTATFMAGSSDRRPFSFQLGFAPVWQADGTIRLVVNTTYYETADVEFLLNNQLTRTTGIKESSTEQARAVKPGEKIRVRLKADGPASQTWAEVVVVSEQPPK